MSQGRSIHLPTYLAVVSTFIWSIIWKLYRRFLILTSFKFWQICSLFLNCEFSKKKEIIRQSFKGYRCELNMQRSIENTRPCKFFSEIFKFNFMIYIVFISLFCCNLFMFKEVFRLFSNYRNWRIQITDRLLEHSVKISCQRFLLISWIYLKF